MISQDRLNYEASNFIKDFNLDDRHRNLKLAFNVTLVALVIAGFVAASVFTFGAAGVAGAAAVAAIGTTAGISSFASAGALYGAGVGLAASALATPFIGKYCNLYDHSFETNTEKVMNFLKTTFIFGACATGYGALCGANDGFKLGLVAFAIAGAKNS